jgi:hypothetical protein
MARKNDEPLTTVTEAATETVQAGTVAATKGFDQTVAAIKDGVSGAVAGFETTQVEMKANMEKVIKTAEEMVSFGQGNVEAFVQSGQIWAAGVQDLSKTVAASAQQQFDAAVSTFKAMSGVKSFKEALDLHASLARGSVETALAETGRLTDASLKLAEQTFAPITARVTLAVEKFGHAA